MATEKRRAAAGSLLIRADAGLAIGTGHVMRCLALAQAWQDDGGTAVLAQATIPADLIPRVKDEHVDIRKIEGPAGGPEDARETIALARHLEAKWVVIDGDHFASSFLDQIRGAGFRVLLLDDFAARDKFPADVIVHPDLDENPEVYQRGSADSVVCMGPAFVLLRREFHEQTPQRQVRETGLRVLITMGGSDPDHLTPRIAAALADCYGLQVTAVAGAGFAKGEELERLEKKGVSVVRNATDMRGLMLGSDLAVIVAGGTLWELLAMGCPVLSYSRNTVQSRVIEELSQRGLAVNLGNTRDFQSARLMEQVVKLGEAPRDRQRMADSGQQLIDGEGARRVVKTMMGFAAQPVMKMAPVAASEREAFLRMAIAHFTDLDGSFEPQEDWKEHYFETIQKNPDYFLRWILCQGERAGFILFGLEKHRFLPRTTGNIFEVYIDPQFRRRGLAKACAQEAIRELWSHGPSKIQLEVLEGRTAATALWESLGFRPLSHRMVLPGRLR